MIRTWSDYSMDKCDTHTHIYIYILRMKWTWHHSKFAIPGVSFYHGLKVVILQLLSTQDGAVGMRHLGVSSYVFNMGIPYTGKTTFVYWDGALLHKYHTQTTYLYWTLPLLLYKLITSCILNYLQEASFSRRVFRVQSSIWYACNKSGGLSAGPVRLSNPNMELIVCTRSLVSTCISAIQSAS